MITGSIRVSTSEQKEKGQQTAFYKDDLKRKGVPEENIFIELARTGSMNEDSDINYKLDSDGKFWIGFDLKKNRPELWDWLVNKVNKGIVEKHFITKWDRWARNLIIGLGLKNYCKSKGCSIEATQDSSDERIVPILLTFAEYESNVDKKRVFDNKLFKFDQGLYIGTKDKFGYKKVNIMIDGRKFITLEPNASKSHIIKEIFNNSNYKEVCEKYQITPSLYYTVKRDRFYCGYIRYNGLEKKGRHQPIISEEEWDKSRIK